MQPALRERAVRLEARRLATARLRARGCFGEAEFRRELPHDLVLQREDVVDRAVNLRVRERLAARQIDDARGDPHAPDLLLEAADDSEPRVQIGGDLTERSVRAP